MVSLVPWPYPDNGAENYVNNGAAGYGKRDRLVLEHPSSRGAG